MCVSPSIGFSVQGSQVSWTTLTWIHSLSHSFSNSYWGLLYKRPHVPHPPKLLDRVQLLHERMFVWCGNNSNARVERKQVTATAQVCGERDLPTHPVSCLQGCCCCGSVSECPHPTPTSKVPWSPKFGPTWEEFGVIFRRSQDRVQLYWPGGKQLK